MRPIALKLQAFGSFPELEFIDFAALADHGLFVVSGPTGTGKTTIFDAMCWALYGDMPLKVANSVRSDHADADTETFVEFTFESDDVRYVVRRTAAWRRRAKLQDRLVEAPATAHLSRLGVQGTDAIETTPTRVTKACGELIGLSVVQFQRVVLLPQGEFSRVLLADSGEREELLGKLFGGDVFDRVAEALKLEADRLRVELAGTDQTIGVKLDEATNQIAQIHVCLGLEVDEELAGAPAAAKRELLAQLAAALSALDAEVATLEDTARQAADQHRALLVGADRFDQVARLVGERDLLESKTEDVEAGSRGAELSRSARPLVDAHEAHRGALDRLTVAAGTSAQRTAELEALFAVLGVGVDAGSVGAIADAAQVERERQSGRRRTLDGLTSAEAAVAKAESAHAEALDRLGSERNKHDAIVGRVAEINSALPVAREAAAGLDQLTLAIEATERARSHRSNLADIEARLESAAKVEARAATNYADTFERYRATEAPRLADALKSGEPCLVCGSTEHPRPATASGIEPTTHEQVAAAAEQRDAAHRLVTELETAAAGERSLLGADAERSLDDLAARLTELHLRFDVARAADEEAQRLGSEQLERTDELNALTILLAVMQTNVDASTVELDDARRRLTEASAAAVGIDAEAVEHEAAILEEIDTLRTGLDALFAGVSSAEGEVSQSAATFDSAVASSPFESVEAARSALVSPEAEASMIAAAAKHTTELAEMTGRLLSLMELGVPEVRPDADAAEVAASFAAATHADRSAVRTTARNAERYALAALDGHDQLVASSGDLRDRRADAAKAYAVCKDGGTLRTSLTRWVLGRELDRVTNAANVHLARMTGDRYSLRRSEIPDDARRLFGLDIEVFDSTTGRPRSTKSLSGGEQFQASLALALGLADVVSHGGTASGKRFEALFVDEGFGSLDPDALDLAISALDQLRASGRMVGAITHVETMKRELPVGIEVRRRANGRGSTLVVNP